LFGLKKISFLAFSFINLVFEGKVFKCNKYNFIMPTRKLNKPPEGAKKPMTADMKAWLEEFGEMKTDDHLAKLKSLGLDDDDLEEFKEMEEGIPLEEELLQTGPVVKEKDSKTTKKKPGKK
jgi:hypothetical protein